VGSAQGAQDGEDELFLVVSVFGPGVYAAIKPKVEVEPGIKTVV
jgi:hypothetical protein